ncbi:MAG TPA: hypothetical protein VGE07_30475 [Herpetosiphonaceae bacterium]
MQSPAPGSSDRSRRRPAWAAPLAAAFFIVGLLQAGFAAMMLLALLEVAQPAPLQGVPGPLLGAGVAVFGGMAGFFGWMGYGLLLPSAAKSARCLHCGARNPLDSATCAACGQPFVSARGARPHGAGQRIIVRGDVFKILAGLLIAAFALYADYSILASGLPNDVEAYVRQSLAPADGARIASHKALTVSAQQLDRGVTEAWCVEIEDPAQAGGRAAYVVYRAGQLRAEPPPAGSCGGLERW